MLKNKDLLARVGVDKAEDRLQELSQAGTLRSSQRCSPVGGRVSRRRRRRAEEARGWKRRAGGGGALGAGELGENEMEN